MAGKFVVINKCTGKLIKIVLCVGVLLALIMAVLIMAMGSGALLGKLQMFMTSPSAGTTGILAFLLFSVFSNLFVLFLMTVFWQIVSAETLNYKQPLSEAFSGSVWPTIYQLLTGLLFAVPSLLIFLTLAVATKLSVVLGLVGFLLVGLVLIRFCYSFVAIAVDNKGPIEGLVHSWKLTAGKNYIDAVLFGLMFIGSMLLLEIFYALIAYAFRVIIPLYFADSFNLAHLSLFWWLGGFVVAILGIFYYLVILAFPVLVYLNRNAQEGVSSRLQNSSTVFIPLPDLDIPVQPDQPVQQPPLQQPQVNMQEDIPPTLPTPPSAPVSDTSHKTELQKQTMEELGIEQTSVNTTEQDTNEITQHLQQVYTPRPEDVVQYADEDRMPTILFDDELAKQLQQGHDIVTNKQPSDPNEPTNGDDSIRLSK